MKRSPISHYDRVLEARLQAQKRREDEKCGMLLEVQSFQMAKSRGENPDITLLSYAAQRYLLQLQDRQFQTNQLEA